MMYPHEMLSPKQRRFINSIKKIVLYSGGVGSLKTTANCYRAIHLLLKYANNRGLIGAESYPQLKDTVQKEFFEILPKHLVEKWVEHRGFLRLINGSELIFRSFDREGKFRSLNLGFACIEEASLIKKEIFYQLLSRIRYAKVPYHSIFLTTNPDSLGHWIYTDLIEAGSDDIEIIYTNTIECAEYLPKDYITTMKSKYSKEYY